MPITPELLDELLKDYKSPDDMFGDDGLLQQLTKAVVERALQGELTHHLGYEKHDAAGKNTGNSRNGKSAKTIKGKRGQLHIDVPRDRNSGFEPRLIRKGQTRFDGFDDKIISMYAHGWGMLYGLNPITITFESSHGWLNDGHWTEYTTITLGFDPQRRIEDKMPGLHERAMKRKQQPKFDARVKKAVRTFRKEYLAQGGKAAVAGILIGGPLGTSAVIISGEVIGSGISLTGLASLAKEGAEGFSTALDRLKGAGLVLLSPFIVGGTLAEQAVGEGGESEKKLNESIADCEKQYPYAKFSGVYLTY